MKKHKKVAALRPRLDAKPAVPGAKPAAGPAAPGAAPGAKPAGKAPAPDVRPIPENLPEELLPLYDWWKANGPRMLAAAAAALIVAAGIFAAHRYRAGKIADANRDLLRANTLDELETAVAKGGGKVVNAIRIRLGKAYYDAGKYEDALKAYRECLEKGAPDGFREIAELGAAFSLEGLARTDDALAAYRRFEKDHPGHYLVPQATMGVARALTVQGKKGDAKKILEDLKARQTGDAAAEMAVARMEALVDRYEPRARRSLFEAADAAAALEQAHAKKAAAEAAKKPAEATAAVKPAEATVATPAKELPAVKPVVKPAEAKPVVKPAEAKPAAKPAEAKPAAKPAEAKPAAKPTAKPAAKPAEATVTTPAKELPAAKPAKPAR